jgi:hypothetical protein
MLADTRLMSHVIRQHAAASSIEAFAILSTAYKDK